VPEKTEGFDTHIMENPKFQAPIPLFPKPDVTETGVSKVKVKLQRNPAQASFTIYEKIHRYRKFQALLNKYTQ
jgi:hypothetical protein